jgi:hypothetical protein
MNLQRRDFLFAVALAGAAATSALGADGVTQRAASIPDFSGIWAHPALGFGPALSGPGPLTNLSRLPSGASNNGRLVGDYRNPILKPEAAEIVRKRGEISISGKAFPDPDNLCFQQPVPYIFWNFDIQLLQQPGKVTIIYQHDNDFRQVRLNQPHPERVIPSPHGDSVGHYEGDTLVIDTIGIKAGPHTMIDRLGTPYTESLHVVERYRLLDYDAAKAAIDRAEKEWPRAGPGFDANYRGKGVQLEFTVEDQGVFTMPWSATVTYLRAERTEWEERICAENVGHDYDHEYFSDRDARLPTADKPDF